MTTLLTSKQAAKKLGFTDEAMRNSRTSGELGGLPAPHFIKLKRCVRYYESDLNMWIEDNAEAGVFKKDREEQEK